MKKRTSKLVTRKLAAAIPSRLSLILDSVTVVTHVGPEKRRREKSYRGCIQYSRFTVVRRKKVSVDQLTTWLLPEGRVYEIVNTHCAVTLRLTLTGYFRV